MDIFIVLLFFIVIYKIDFSGKYFYADNLNNNKIGGGTTTSFRGIFAVLIFLSHSKQYINIDGRFNSIFVLQNTLLGQLIVVIFFFYSGFGIMESYKKKQNYFATFPKRRVLKTLINFDIAILLYMILNLCFGRHYSIYDNLLSFIGWTSIGNSNWFIFAILICYISTYISWLAFKNKKLLTLSTTVLLFIYILVLSVLNKGTYWFDTILTFPFGMLFSIYFDKLKNIFTKNNFNYIVSLIVSILMFCILFLLRKYLNYLCLISNLIGILFCLILTLISYKIRLKNPILTFLGNHSFDIYILQRIPMIALSYTPLQTARLTFITVSFILTIVLCLAYNKICSIITKRLKIS